jgi:hypothetical protein
VSWQRTARRNNALTDAETLRSCSAATTGGLSGRSQPHPSSAKARAFLDRASRDDRRREGHHLGGETLADDGPVLQAIDRLIRISERRAKLRGLDAPVTGQAGATVRYELVGVDPEQLTW